MAKIAYRGRSDFRTLSQADIKKLGSDADFTKTSFARNEPTEVSAEIAKLLTDEKHRLNFHEVKDEGETPAESKPAAKK